MVVFFKGGLLNLDLPPICGNETVTKRTDTDIKEASKHLSESYLFMKREEV